MDCKRDALSRPQPAGGAAQRNLSHTNPRIRARRKNLNPEENLWVEIREKNLQELCAQIHDALRAKLKYASAQPRKRSKPKSR
jgi:hypothetical protein